MREAAEEGVLEVQLPLREAGAAAEGGQVEGGQEEFLPILAALAPTLISGIGPAVAKGVMSKLSPRAKRASTGRVRRPPRRSRRGWRSRASGRTTPRAHREAPHGPASPTQGRRDRHGSRRETFIEEAARAMEVILGKDDRLRITNTTGFRGVACARCASTFPSGSTYRGTGFLIGAARLDGRALCGPSRSGRLGPKMEVIPGANGTQRPYGQAASSDVALCRRLGDRQEARERLRLHRAALGRVRRGESRAASGARTSTPSKIVAQPAVLGGFPGDKAVRRIVGHVAIIKTVAAKTLIYDIDTVGGQSGAPVYIMRAGQRYVIGIHNYGAASGNSATRVTEPVYQRLLAWSQIDAAPSATMTPAAPAARAGAAFVDGAGCYARKPSWVRSARG